MSGSPIAVDWELHTSALAPAGPAAASIAGLTWILIGLLTVVYVAVLALLIIAARRQRRADVPPGAPRTDRLAIAGVIAGGVVVPVIVVTVLLIVGLRVLNAVVPRADADAVAVDVTARQFWWEIRYVDAAASETVVTANELHVPVGRRVRVRLFSKDVIHSFWVAPLQGKLDLIPGITNVTWLQADRPGVYRAPCAEYCGIQHANMVLFVVAQPPAEFEAWLADQRRPALPPLDEQARRGQQLFVNRGCAFCHTIRGSFAFFGTEGPDLTHLLSRRTLAAGLLANSRGTRAGWIANPQALKPGNRMPAVPLEADEFHAVLSYLESLH